MDYDWTVLRLYCNSMYYTWINKLQKEKNKKWHDSIKKIHIFFRIPENSSTGYYSSLKTIPQTEIVFNRKPLL